MSLSEIFEKAGITHAHIIDDAYDTRPTSALTPGSIQTFVEDLDEESFDRLGTLLGLAGANGDALVEALQVQDNVHRLFKGRAQFAPGSTDLFADYLRSRTDKRAKIKPLLDLLRKNKVKVQTFGANSPLKRSKEPQLVFIDLQLKEGVPVTVDDAVDVYRRVKEAHKTCMPFVFLFSTLASAVEARREEFRDKSKLFISQFESLDKAKLDDDAELEGILSAYAEALPGLREMHNALQHVTQAIGGANERLFAVLMALDLADYFVLHSNTVSIERSRLGTYVSELVMEFLTHEIEQSVQFWDFAKSLDSWKIKDLPRSRFGFTRVARRIYSGTMLHAPVRLAQEVERGLGPKNGYFYLGDIFFEKVEMDAGKPTKALVIATPACDLARPEDLKDRTVFLCEGKVSEAKEFDLPTGDDGLAAVILPKAGSTSKQWLIRWNLKLLRTWRTKEMDEFKDDPACTYQRVGRLRLIYAIQLQRAIASDLSRIGVQRTPSLLVPHGLEVYVAFGGKWKILDKVDAKNGNAAALSVMDDKKKKTAFIVTDPSARRINRALLEWSNKPAQVLIKDRIEQLSGASNGGQRWLYVEQFKDDKAPHEFVCFPLADPEIQPVLDSRYDIAFVRPFSNSPYDSVGGGKDVATDQKAVVVFKFIRIGT